MNSSSSVLAVPVMARQLFVKAEVVLECDRCERHVLGLNRDVFFGFDGLVQTVGQTAAFHHPACEHVNQNNLTIANDVVLVPLEHDMRQ